MKERPQPPPVLGKQESPGNLRQQRGTDRSDAHERQNGVKSFATVELPQRLRRERACQPSIDGSHQRSRSFAVTLPHQAKESPSARSIFIRVLRIFRFPVYRQLNGHMNELAMLTQTQPQVRVVKASTSS